MASDSKSRGRVLRRIAVGAVAAAGLTLALATPASAATSQGYNTMARCEAEQTAVGSTGFVRITRACYSYLPQIAPGVWDPMGDPKYRFEYRSRY